MKTWKRALALVLALVMALSLVALPSFAEGEETGGGTESGPKWDDPGSILLNKVAQPVENKEGIYEITLTIQGKNFETNSDVVLVIDKSGSMNDDDKLLDTKKAAIAFGEKLLTKGAVLPASPLSLTPKPLRASTTVISIPPMSWMLLRVRSMASKPAAAPTSRPVSMWPSSCWTLILP